MVDGWRRIVRNLVIHFISKLYCIMVYTFIDKPVNICSKLMHACSICKRGYTSISRYFWSVMVYSIALCRQDFHMLLHCGTRALWYTIVYHFLCKMMLLGNDGLALQGSHTSFDWASSIQGSAEVHGWDHHPILLIIERLQCGKFVLLLSNIILIMCKCHWL